MRIIQNEGVFRLYDKGTTLILTDEKQLYRIAEHPDMPLFDDEERGFSGEKKGIYPPGTTLNSFMKEAYERGCTRVEVSYDFFFGGSRRENYPDDEITMKAYKVIHDYAKKYGMGFGASVLSPLDLGGGYVKRHADRGYTWQMEEGAIENGAYALTVRRQKQWYNNKGPIQLTLTRAMAFAFDERPAKNGRDLVVDFDGIIPIDPPAWKKVPDTDKVSNSGYGWDEIVVSGKANTDKKRVFLLLEYATPEQDYFADDALDYMKGVLDAYDKLGVKYAGFYSDEMHIQFDWDLVNHFGPTEIKTRYVTDSLIREFAARYQKTARFGVDYTEFARCMLYFAYTKHEDGLFHNHMMADSADGAYETVLFRKRYFEMLSRRIVNLSKDAKAYAESLSGAPIMTVAHSTWQESPTCDHFSEDFAFSEQNRKDVTRYDYDKPYVWSSTIRENMSACGDYFRWNEFLTGSGTDHAEGGNADRNYYSQAFAASLGTLNPYERAYCACWGSPAPVIRRFTAVGNTYGTTGLNGHGLVQNMKTRLSDVLFLYPTELNYAEERFGSWMVQYGYCDFITEEKLIENAVPTDDGLLHVNGKAYRAVVALFEPFVDETTIALFLKFACSGGTVIWTGPAALRLEDGSAAKKGFLELFGLKEARSVGEGVPMEDALVQFEGALDGIKPMQILTGLLPDHVYPVEPNEAEVVARINGVPVGTVTSRGLGKMCCLGFRPRDDQSTSLGTDVSTLFDILNKLGAYAPDSLEAASRPEDSRYIMNKFANGAISIANHYRTFAEDWYGSFFRDEERDKALLEGRALPPIEIALENACLGGKTVTYTGEGCLTFNTDENGALTGFAGENTRGITVNGKAYDLFTENAALFFANIDASRLAPGVKAAIVLMADREGVFTLPLPKGFENAKAAVLGDEIFDTQGVVEMRVSGENAEIAVTKDTQNKYIAVYVA